MYVIYLLYIWENIKLYEIETARVTSFLFSGTKHEVKILMPLNLCIFFFF